MLNATFFIIQKKKNSTKQPTQGTLHFSMQININDSESSLLAPQIRVRKPDTITIYEYNYVYIDAFGRYYYILNWYYNGDGTWTASCEVDVLASWRSSILVSGGYVGRGNANVNPAIADVVYPSETQMVNVIDSVNTGMSDNINNGTVIIGVVDKGTSLVGPVSYYAMTPSAFTILCNALMNYGIEDDFNSITSINTSAIKSILDPLQYIVSCKWFPMRLSDMFTTSDYTYATSIYVGGWAIDFGNVQANHPRELNKTAFTYPGVNTSPVPDLIIQDLTYHLTPNQNVGGIDRFPNYPPYASYTLFTPWGVHELDGDIIFNMFRNHEYQTRKIRCTWNVYGDIVTGLGTFVFRGDLNPNSLNPVEDDYEFFRTDVQIAVDIPIASMALDYLGISSSLGSSVQSGANAIGHFAAKDVLGFIGNLPNFFNGLNNAVAKSKSPVLDSHTNGIAAFNNTITKISVQQTRYRTVDQCDAVIGKPVKKYFATLTDFAAVSDPFIQMDKSLYTGICTEQEQKQIIGYLESGCYLE